MGQIKYYNIEDDLRDYPAAWAYIITGGRATGKTYGALYYAMHNKIKFVFAKRTIDDVKLLCGTGRLSEFEIDLSPFKPINRDYCTNIRARIISDKGIGGFWHFSDGEPQGDPIGYILALSAVQKFKGFDLSECDLLIMDEYQPQPWERVNKKEGEQILDLYKTIARDRELRGRDPLKIIALANAVSISNPLHNILEITDTMADMQASGQDVYYDRGIFVRLLKTPDDIHTADVQTLIYKAMHNTKWGQMAYDNVYAYDDLSSIGKVSLKGYICDCRIIYKTSEWFLYRKQGRWYLSASRSDKYRKSYDLNKENDQKLFNVDKRIDLYDRTAQGKVVYENYTMYDVIMNYSKHFRL